MMELFRKRVNSASASASESKKTRHSIALISENLKNNQVKFYFL